MVLATRSWQMPRALAMARAMWQGAHVVPLVILCFAARQDGGASRSNFTLSRFGLRCHTVHAVSPTSRLGGEQKRQQQDQRFIAMVTTALTAAWTEGSRTDEPRPLATEKIEVWLRDMVL